MGYMICQCSIGAFAPAMIHIIMHGIFKANLFLHSPSTAKEQVVHNHKQGLGYIVISIFLGLMLTSCFLYGYGNIIPHFNASLVFVGIVFIFSSQFSMTIIEKHKSYIATFASLLLGGFIAIIYGKVISVLDNAFGYHAPLELKWMHIVFISILFFGWLLVALRPKNFGGNKFANFLYIKLLNLSQPNPKTITKNRNSYNF